MKSRPPQACLLSSVKGRSRGNVFSVEGFHVLNLNERDDESVPVLCPNSEHGFVHELEMYAGAVARHGAVERWLPMQEVDRETESVLEEPGRRFDVGNGDHRDRARESKCRRCAFGLRR